LSYSFSSFQSISIEDSFQIVYDYPTDPIVFSGVFLGVNFAATMGEPVTWTARAKFIQGTSISIYELDTPTPPLNLELDSPSPGTIDVDWDDPITSGSNPLTGFRVEYAILGGAFVNIDLGLVNSTTIVGLAPGTYNVRVIAKSSLGLGEAGVLEEIVVA